MKRIRLAFCFFALLFCSAFSQMTEEKRKKLYSKVVKRIDISKPNDFIVPLNDIYWIEEIKYDSNKIKQIISENNFPESYNFFDATNVQKRVKDQERCGCCWAFASSTALGYRYAKAGYESFDCIISTNNSTTRLMFAGRYFDIVTIFSARDIIFSLV